MSEHREHEGDEFSFPFDLVFVFNESKKGAKEYADNLYSDMKLDGLFVCKYVRKYRGGVNRIFLGVGASDRFLHAIVEHYHFSEERTEVREHQSIKRIYAQNTRQRILMRFLKLRQYGGPHASIKWLQSSGMLVDYFLLHDPKEIYDIRKGFFRYIFLPPHSFIAEVEEYFGEELAMYMAWVRTLIVFIGPLCAAYIVFFAFEIYDNYSSWSLAAAGYFAPVYIQFFHEYWKREEQRLAFEFGTLDLEETAEVREGFKGTLRLIQWKSEKEKHIEGENAVIVKAGTFELPIQHTVPVNTRLPQGSPTSQQAAAAGQQDPFTVKVLEQLNFNALPQNVFETHYPNSTRLAKYGVTFPTTIALCAAVMVAIYAIDFIREVLSLATGRIPTQYSIAISVINGVVIVLFNTVYPLIARKLADWENHRTQEEFESSYILKLFLFIFINSYFPIYLQIFKLYIVSSDKLASRSKAEATQAVVIQIFSACVSTVFVSNIQDVVVPFFLGPLVDRVRVWWAGHQLRKMLTRGSDARNEPTSVDLEASPTVEELSPTFVPEEAEGGSAHQQHHHDHHSDSRENFISKRFTEMESHRHVFEHQMSLAEPQPVTARFMGRIILFGFSVIFAALFPLGVVFLFLDAVLTCRVEIVRYLYLMRRMPARQVESIGGWRTSVQVIIVVSAVTNCLILAMESDSLTRWYGLSGTFESRLVMFIASEHIVMFLIFVVEYLIPDTSMDILRFKALQRYLMLKEQNRLTYDAIDRQMRPHVLLQQNILPDEPNQEHSNKTCVQCNVELVPDEDVVRMLPCHHHIHDEPCLAEFTKNEESAQCPRCHVKVDCRNFSDQATYQNYLTTRERIVDVFLADPDVTQDKDAMVQIMGQENNTFLQQCEHFGIMRNSFPDVTRQRHEQQSEE